MAHEYEGNDQHWFSNVKGNCKWCNKPYFKPVRILVSGLQTAYVPYCSNKCLHEDASNPIEYYESVIKAYIDSGKKKSDDEFFKMRSIDAQRRYEIESKIREEEKKREEMALIEANEKRIREEKIAEIRKLTLYLILLLLILYWLF